MSDSQAKDGVTNSTTTTFGNVWAKFMDDPLKGTYYFLACFAIICTGIYNVYRVLPEGRLWTLGWIAVILIKCGVMSKSAFDWLKARRCGRTPTFRVISFISISALVPALASFVAPIARVFSTNDAFRDIAGVWLYSLVMVSAFDMLLTILCFCVFIIEFAMLCVRQGFVFEALKDVNVAISHQNTTHEKHLAITEKIVTKIAGPDKEGDSPSCVAKLPRGVSATKE